MDPVQHVVLTRFAIRYPESSREAGTLPRRASARRNLDPLNSRRLQQRLRIFETVTVPGLRSQTRQDFTWIVVIDPQLDDASRDRLRDRLAPLENAVLVEYDADQPLMEPGWMRPHVNVTGGQYLLTSNIDDDDNLPRTFVADLREAMDEGVAKNLPIQIGGYSKAFQWDLSFSGARPLGSYSDWTRRASIVSCGFSLLARQPDYNLTVLGLSHARADEILDRSSPPTTPRVAADRSRVEHLASKAGEQPDDWDYDMVFHDLSPDGQPRPVMTNHLTNLQGARLLEPRRRTPVAGATSFPNNSLDWEEIVRDTRAFRIGPAEYVGTRLRYAVHRTRWRAGRARRALLGGRGAART